MLKKPSELYPRNGVDSSSVKTPLQDSVQLKSFKDNIQKINSLSDFSETLDTYRQSVDNVNFLSKEVESIRADIKELLTTEYLDRAMMSQYVLVEQTISDVQKKVKSINESKLKDIRESVESLTNSVGNFIEEDIPKYKKLFFDNEVLKERLEYKAESVEEYKKEIDEKVKVQEFYVDEHRKDLDIKFKDQESFVENYKKEIEQKITDLHADIILNESVVRVQNSNIEQIKESIQSAIQKLNYDEIEKQNYQLANKIKYLEEVFEKFSEKELLTENVDSVPPSETNLNENFVTVEYLQNHYRNFINRIQQQLSSLGGGGEVNLRYLDDIVGIATNLSAYNGKYLQVDTSDSNQPFKFTTVVQGGGGGGSGITTASVRDAIQGYYGYTTDFYTVGVANTTQEIGAGVTTMIQPKVAAVYQYMPTIMSGVNTNPYVGTGATIGTGQTEFSLAGLGSGASCIVRTALGFNPDDDNSNLDVQLKFTTNTATQGTGLTNFTIKKEQALIMNEGADQQYISENLFSFFVGPTLQGTTQSNAGSFNIEVVPTSEGELEVLAVTVNLVA